MALVEMVMPKMGESVTEGTVPSWLKSVGDPIEEDESILEVATDKVDTEIPSTPRGGTKGNSGTGRRRDRSGQTNSPDRNRSRCCQYPLRPQLLLKRHLLSRKQKNK